MPNFTIEDYKKAIQEKYDREAAVVDFLNPSQANLRNLCWEIFERNANADDLAVFESFFGFSFDRTRRNQFREHTDRFRPIGTFYRRRTDLTDRDAVNLAAILIDFQPRPFRNFRERGVIDYEVRSNPENSPPPPQPFVTKKEEEVKFEFKEKELPKAPQSFVSIPEEGNSDSEFDHGSTNNMNSGQSIILPVVQKPVRISVFKSAKERIIYNFKNRLKKTALATIVIFLLIGAVVYFAFFKKHCMQWTGDHYEIVDCSSNIQPGDYEITQIDESLLEFKKLKACDTTAWFGKNGDPIVWYCKTANGIDFFNDIGNGWHPENKRSLHPMTSYMFNKYLKGKPCE